MYKKNCTLIDLRILIYVKSLRVTLSLCIQNFTVPLYLVICIVIFIVSDAITINGNLHIIFLILR